MAQIYSGKGCGEHRHQPEKKTYLGPYEISFILSQIQFYFFLNTVFFFFRVNFSGFRFNFSGLLFNGQINFYYSKSMSN